MSAAYAELHCLSNFTFLRGASHAGELVARAAKLGYTALAITDECSVAGVVRAHAAAKEHQFKLIIGAEFCATDGLRFVLLAQNRAGYGNLCELITRGRRNAKKGEYRLSRDDLDAGSEHCIALWLPPAQADAGDAQWLAARFPERTWIAAELLLRGGDRDRLDALRELGHRTGLPLTACGDVHMHARGRRALQDTLTAIRLRLPVAQAGRALHPSGERHLRPRETLERLYPRELLEQTVRIANLCDFSLDELRYEYPEEIVPAGKTPAQHLRDLTEEGLQRRYASRGASLVPPDQVPHKVRDLVGRELALIAELRYEPFFLTVHDVVRFARSQGILCQGRGSAANSAVCFALGITEVDPGHMEVLFERFISRERNEPPDIDVDFEHERREEVIQYLYRKYGRDRAALAATVITYRSRSAFRDVGKALGLDLAQLERISRSFVWWDRRDQRATRLREAGLDPETPVIRKLIALTDTLIGFPRHLSQHVGGFVISRGPLAQLVPVENAAMEDRTIIQWDKDDLDELGLLKVDVLALGMLSAIRRALDLVNRRRGSALSMADVLATETGAEGRAVYDMLCKADSVGVFQIESRAQMSMLPRLKPRCYYDLVIEVAIVRPGPIQGGMVHPYLKRRQDPAGVSYPSPALEAVLKRTLGVPIFQEQVMQIAIVAAGFNPGEADQLRRSMAAWRRKGGLEHFEEKLLTGMRDRGYSAAFARQIYQQILGFGEYGFPESHSASFALLVYVSAWLKCHEPAAFTCALLNSQPMGFYAPSQLVQDAQRHGVEIRPVDVMASEWMCTLEEGPNEKQVLSAARLRWTREHLCRLRRPGFTHKCWVLGNTGKSPCVAIRLGLRMISGFSQEAAERLIAARSTQHPALPLRDVEDLAQRANLSRRDLRLLAEAGALESLSGHRRNAAWLVAGIEKRPALLARAPIAEPGVDLPAPTEGQDIVADYALTGLTLRRHPLALLRPRLRKLRMLTAAELLRVESGKPVHVAGLVTGRQRPGTASGVIFVTLEDETGQINVVVWKAVSEKQRRPLLGARLLGVHGVLEREGEVTHLIAGRLTDHSALLGDLDVSSRDFH